MELDRDRLTFLLRVFVHGPGFTHRALAVAAGISPAVLSPGYEWRPEPETVEKIAGGAAELLHIDAARLIAWLHGQEDIELQAWFAELLHLVECVGAPPASPSSPRMCRYGSWFPESMITPGLSMCPDCVRDAGRANMFKRRLAKNPELAKFYDDLEKAKPAIRKANPDLYAALKKLEGEAITRPKIGRIMGISAAKVLEVWNALGLPLKILFASSLALAGPRASAAVPLKPPHISAKTGRGRRKGRSAPGAGDRPPKKAIAKKKGRRGRPRPAEAAARVSAAARHSAQGAQRALRGTPRGAGAGQLRLFALAEAGR